jgi:hypothetical protein
MSTRKPHNQDAGYICELIFKPSRSHIVIYKAAEQGIDAGGDKYAVVCSTHGSLVGVPNLPKAREVMKCADFCEDCMLAARRIVAAHIQLDPHNGDHPYDRARAAYDELTKP